MGPAWGPLDHLLDDPTSRTQRRAAFYAERLLVWSIETGQDVVYSTRGLGDALGVCWTTAWRMVRHLEDMGVLFEEKHGTSVYNGDEEDDPSVFKVIVPESLLSEASNDRNMKSLFYQDPHDYLVDQMLTDMSPYSTESSSTVKGDRDLLLRIFPSRYRATEDRWSVRTSIFDSEGPDGLRLARWWEARGERPFRIREAAEAIGTSGRFVSMQLARWVTKGMAFRNDGLWTLKVDCWSSGDDEADQELVRDLVTSGSTARLASSNVRRQDHLSMAHRTHVAVRKRWRDYWETVARAREGTARAMRRAWEEGRTSLRPPGVEVVHARV